MKKIIEKHEMIVCISLIILYLVVNSFCKQEFGTTDYRSVIFNFLYAIVLLLIIVSTGRTSYYGFTKIHDMKRYLYFIPLLFILSVNLWGGVNVNNTPVEILWHTLSMCCIGFSEEIIFRGFLFKMMEKDNVKIAMLVSSLTFGIGHVVNLLNGAEVIPTLLQMGYAVSLGYLFVVIFYRSKSIIPCVITHAVFNVLSITETEIDQGGLYYAAVIFLIVVPLAYAAYINRTVKK